MIHLLVLVALLLLASPRPHGRTLRIAHLSGHWKANPRHLVAALAYLADHEGAELITLTEVSPAKFRTPLERWAHARGWHIRHPQGAGANECAVLSKHQITKTRARQLTRLKLRIGRTAPTFLVSAHVKGWGWFSVLHTPAHTGGLRDVGSFSWPTRVYRSIVDTLHVIGLQSRRMWTILADWNLHLELDRNRQLIEKTFPGLQLLNPKGQKPTVGDRVIDGGATSLPIVQPLHTVQRRFPDIDHLAVVGELGEEAS